MDENPDSEQLTYGEVIESLKDKGADQQLAISQAKVIEHTTYKVLLDLQTNPKSRQEQAAFIEAIQPFQLTPQELLEILNFQPKNVETLGLFIANLNTAGNEEDEQLDCRFDDKTQEALVELILNTFSTE